MDKVHYEVEDIVGKLEEKGLNSGNSVEEYLAFLWNLYQVAERNLLSANNSLEELKQQQAEEMKEVESYVAHIRSLTEEREALTTDFEKENIQLRLELEKMQLQQESQLKEVEEMLDQEGLSEIAQSSPSEQVAYLLVERATLLEKLEALELKLDSHLENLSIGKQQDELEYIRRTLEEELCQQRESMRQTKESLSKTFEEELDKERKAREGVERDLNEAAQRLKMAHDEIRKLTDDLLIKKKEVTELEHIMEKKQQEAEASQQELKDINEKESLELQKAKEHNLRLDKEILALRQRVRTLDTERKKRMEQGDKSDSDSMSSNKNMQEIEELHKRCRLEVEEKECLNQQLLHKLQKLRKEYDDIVERNEELESILGETQNHTKEQVDYLEGEIAGLNRTIINLESELTELAEQREAEDPADALNGTGSDIGKMSELKQELADTRTMLMKIQDKLFAAEQENLSLCSRNEQLEKEKHNKVSELMKQCQKLKMDVLEKKSCSCSQADTNKHLGDVEKEQMRVALSEQQRKCEALQRQIQEGLLEKQQLWEENMQLRKDVTMTRQDLQARKDEIKCLRQDLFNLQNPMPQPKICGEEAGDAITQTLVGEALIQQQFEEIRQLRQDLSRVNNVCSSAEKELRYERDKNLDLKKQIILLQKENTKISEELSHVKQKLATMTIACSNLEAEREQQQQKVKMMELELLKMSRNTKVQSSWQEKLEHEKVRAADAEKMVSELQQQLRASQHQVTLLETQAADKRHLEEDLKKAREREAKLKMDLQEEMLKKKVLDESLEVLQQEIKALHEKEIALTESNCTLQIKLHQQESMLQLLDEEKKAAMSECASYESTSHKLQEKLQDMQQEKEQLVKEYEILLKRLDDSIRKYNETQLRQKAKLSRAKEGYLNEVDQKDQRIKQLEMELSVSKSQMEKEQQLMSNITALNERLHEEKRQLLLKITEHEASASNLKWMLRSLKNRMQILDEENQQLRESVLQLYSQMRSLKLLLKKLQALNLPDITMMIPPEWMLRGDDIISLPNDSLACQSSPLCTRMADGDLEPSPDSPLPVTHSEASEVGYLNVPSPNVTFTVLGDSRTPEPDMEDV